MMNIEIIHPDGTVKQLNSADDVVIGRGMENEIQLNNWRVAKEHARLFNTAGGIFVEDLGSFSGVQVNGARVHMQHGPLKQNDVVGIGPFRLKVTDAEPGFVVQAAHPASRSDTAAYRNRRATEQVRASRERAQHAQRESTNAVAPHGQAEQSLSVIVSLDQQQKQLEFEWRRRLHGQLLETMDLRRHDVHQMSDQRLREETTRLLKEIIDGLEAEIPASLDRQLLTQQVLNEAIGLGPLEELLADDSVTEVMVNCHDEIYVERAGRLVQHPLTFTGPRAVMGVIERIVAPLGRRIDESSPMVDARLKDGSRVNAIIPPLAIKGPCLTIRKFAKHKLTAEDLVRYGSVNEAMAEFLQICVEARKNIIVSGGTGSGKTTLLNILSNFIPLHERIITVEDAAELKLNHAHLVTLEARPANVEGRGAIAIRDLVRNTLRMRPDRIVVGECRGAEAIDMLQAMNTGHEGSLTTLHANTVRDALARLETMVLMTGMDLPLTAIREQITSAVDIVIQQTRFACGSRIVTSIAEITGIESGKIQMQEIFHFSSQGYCGPGGKIAGFFTGCGFVPSFYEELIATGRQLDINIFMPEDTGVIDDIEEVQA